MLASRKSERRRSGRRARRRRDQPVALAVGSGRHGHDVVRAELTGRRAVEVRVPVVEDAPVDATSQ